MDVFTFIFISSGRASNRDVSYIISGSAYRICRADAWNGEHANLAFHGLQYIHLGLLRLAEYGMHQPFAFGS